MREFAPGSRDLRGRQTFAAPGHRVICKFEAVRIAFLQNIGHRRATHSLPCKYRADKDIYKPMQDGPWAVGRVRERMGSTQRMMQPGSRLERNAPRSRFP